MAMMHAPPNVAHSIVRSGVLDRLEARWTRTVTTVVAGAGFGKSVALGQALRANRTQPRGIEAWASCRMGCESPERMAATLEAAYGMRAAGRGSPLARLYGIFADLAPLDASLVLDDVELLPGACAALLDDLLRGAPSNLHVVLCGRRLPGLALARFRAADDLVEIGADALRFDAAEIAALAASLHARPLERDLAGWPALVRLALVAPRGAVDEYLWEEVISILDPADRAALLALCLLGPSGVGEVEAVTGYPFVPDGFCDRVPLVHRAGEQVVAHDLWTPYLDGLGSPDEMAAMSQRVLDAVRARGDPLAVGEVALRLGDAGALRRAAVDLVRDTLGSLPVAVADTWSAALRASGSDADVETELLDCALAHSRSAADPPADRLDALAARFHGAGDGHGEAAALAVGALAGQARNDVGHLVSLAARARALVTESEQPHLQLLVDSVDAALSALAGDLDGALALLGRPVAGVAPSDRPEAFLRLHWHLLLLAGRAAEAAELTSGMSPVPGLAVQRELNGAARWLDGDPSGLVPGEVDNGPDRYLGTSERDRFDQAAFVAPIVASGDDPEAVHLALDVIETSPFAADAGPDGALTAVARACGAVVDRDDDRAAAVIARFVEGGPLDPFTEAHLRRHLAVPYVCSPELRRRWDAACLGPSQERARAVARLLLDTRAGVVPISPPDLRSVATALPFGWSVELATRAAARAPWGAGLAVVLTDLFGDGVAREVAGRLDDPDARVRRGAAAVLRALPARPPAAVGIRVLGPLEVRHDGRPVEQPEVHRTRVRELLSLLVVERTVDRDRVIDLLWPDLDPARGRANLRVTLRHLQRLLQPERGQGSSPYFLRGDAQRLQLGDVPGLEVDHWQAEELLARAEAAHRQGDAASRAGHLRAAVALWRGRALADLDRLAGLAHLSRHVESRLVDAAVALGELELVGGATDAAATLAERALAADRYAERAHCLSVAARLQGRDRSSTAAAVDRLSAMLDEVGADPEPATEILLRNAAQWLGPVTSRPGSG